MIGGVGEWGILEATEREVGNWLRGEGGEEEEGEYKFGECRRGEKEAVEDEEGEGVLRS